MRAKFSVVSVTPFGPTNGPVENEQLVLQAVTEKPFDPDGKSEDNDWARWTPSGKLEMTVQNPALFGKFKPGQRYYLDFTEADPVTGTSAASPEAASAGSEPACTQA